MWECPVSNLNLLMWENTSNTGTDHYKQLKRFQLTCTLCRTRTSTFIFSHDKFLNLRWSEDLKSLVYVITELGEGSGLHLINRTCRGCRKGLSKLISGSEHAVSKFLQKWGNLSGSDLFFHPQTTHARGILATFTTISVSKSSWVLHTVFTNDPLDH